MNANYGGGLYDNCTIFGAPLGDETSLGTEELNRRGFEILVRNTLFVSYAKVNGGKDPIYRFQDIYSVVGDVITLN